MTLFSRTCTEKTHKEMWVYWFCQGTFCFFWAFHSFLFFKKKAQMSKATGRRNHSRLIVSCLWTTSNECAVPLLSPPPLTFEHLAEHICQRSRGAAADGCEIGNLKSFKFGRFYLSSANRHFKSSLSPPRVTQEVKET